MGNQLENVNFLGNYETNFKRYTQELIKGDVDKTENNYASFMSAKVRNT